MHFTVAVFSKPDQNFEDLLAPFQENNMGDCPEEYLEFIDMTEDIASEFENGTRKKIIGPDGEMYDIWDSRFNYIPDPSNPWNKEKRIPEGYKEVDVPLKELYSSLDEFATEYYYPKDENGRYGYVANPNSKWDWYQVGGRWPGMLILKKNATGSKGSVTLLASHEFRNRAYSSIDGQQRVDSALIKDIDWEKMKEASIKEANEAWEEIQEKINSGDAQLAEFLFNYKQGMSKEEYVNNYCIFTAYAVITPDGEWIEKDWDNETKSYDTSWDEKFFDRFIANADPELRITIVDCHV